MPAYLHDGTFYVEDRSVLIIRDCMRECLRCCLTPMACVCDQEYLLSSIFSWSQGWRFEHFLELFYVKILVNLDGLCGKGAEDFD